MRLTFEHREEPGFWRKSYYVDCTALFSEEEKAVIRVREFGPGMSFGSPRRAVGFSTLEEVVGTIWIMGGTIAALGLLLMVGGFIWASKAIEGGTSFFGPLLVFGAPAFYLVSKFMVYREEHSMDKQFVTFDHLFEGRPFTVWAINPSDAKSIEKEIEQKFSALKQLINENAELAEKRTVEL